jgi:hypothetical protein
MSPPRPRNLILIAALAALANAAGGCATEDIVCDRPDTNPLQGEMT